MEYNLKKAKRNTTRREDEKNKATLGFNLKCEGLKLSGSTVYGNSVELHEFLTDLIYITGQ